MKGPRYLPQGVFDGLAIACAMSTLTGNDDILVRPLKIYLSSYPDEDAKALVHDIYLALIDVNKAVDQCFEFLRRAAKLTKADEDRIRLVIIKRLFGVLIERERNQQSPWRRLFGGTRFNYEKTLLVRRVENCPREYEQGGVIAYR